MSQDGDFYQQLSERLTSFSMKPSQLLFDDLMELIRVGDQKMSSTKDFFWINRKNYPFMMNLINSLVELDLGKNDPGWKRKVNVKILYDILLRAVVSDISLFGTSQYSDDLEKRRNFFLACDEHWVDLYEVFIMEQKNIMVNGKVLGEGTTSIVIAGEALSGPPRLLAIKIIKERFLKFVPDEIKIMQELDKVQNEHIVKFYGVEEIKFKLKETSAYILEFCHEDLNSLMKRKRLNATEVYQCYDGIVQGLKVIHGMDILHLDIKPANIFINIENDRIISKLVDFGTSCFERDCGDSIRGTEGYMNLIEHSYRVNDNTNVKYSYSYSSDFYSLGKVLADMMGDVKLETPLVKSFLLDSPERRNPFTDPVTLEIIIKEMASLQQ